MKEYMIRPKRLRGLALAGAIAAAGACGDQTTEPAVVAGAPPALSAEVEGIGVEAVATVDFRLLIDTITKGIIADSTGDYVIPYWTYPSRFRQAMDSVEAGKIAGADKMLDSFGYDVYSIREAETGDTIVVFRERVSATTGKVRRGWGTYAYNRRHVRRTDIEVNHPISDQHTEDIGAELYRDCRCRWFLMAGAERDANHTDMSSDVAHYEPNVFTHMHQQQYFRSNDGNARALSIHGFLEARHDSLLPDGVDIVMSNGGTVTRPIPQYGTAEQTLRTRLRDGGFDAGLFFLDAGYNDLGGRENLQGRWSIINFGFGRWMHVEIERNVRTDETRWRAMNDVIRQWIMDFPT